MPGIFDAYFAALQQTNKSTSNAQQAPGYLWSGLDYVEEEIESHVFIQPNLSLPRLERIAQTTQEILASLQDELAVLELKDECLYCGTMYIRNQNIGFHRCRWHPNPGTHPSFYDCCGESKRMFAHSGCQPCDHSAKFNAAERWHIENQTIDVPLLIAMRFNIPRQHYTVQNQTDLIAAKAIVQRCKV